MQYYYAVFEKTDEAIEVYFPDIENAFTFGSTWEEAHTMAIDVLAAILADMQKRPEATTLDNLLTSELLKKNVKVMAIPVDEQIMQQYEATKRVNVIFKTSDLAKIDAYRGAHGLKRSEFLAMAAANYMSTRR